MLNHPSSANEEAINCLPQVEINISLAEVPMLNEVNKAISSPSNGKAPGSGGGGPIRTGKTHRAVPANVNGDEFPQRYQDPPSRICTRTRTTREYVATIG